MQLVQWHFWIGPDYQGTTRLPLSLTRDEAIARFEKRTGLAADHAAVDR